MTIAVMKSTFLCKVCLFLVLVSRRPANSFEVDNTASPVVTRTGCKVSLTCGGFGSSIEWTRFGGVAPLEENENQSTSTRMVAVENVSALYLIAHANITAFPAINNQRFQCFIRGSPPGDRTITHQVLLRVNPKVVAIEPPISDTWDVSSYHIGSNITIGCPVQTCAQEVSIAFLNENGSIIRSFSDQQGITNRAYVLTLPVTENIGGNYACKVDTANPSYTDMQYFNITGTPKPALPTTAPPTVDGTTSPTTPGEGGGDNQNGGDGNNNSAVSLSYPLSLLATTFLTLLLLPWL